MVNNSRVQQQKVDKKMDIAAAAAVGMNILVATELRTTKQAIGFD